MKNLDPLHCESFETFELSDLNQLVDDFVLMKILLALFRTVLMCTTNLY